MRACGHQQLHEEIGEFAWMIEGSSMNPGLFTIHGCKEKTDPQRVNTSLVFCGSEKAPLNKRVYLFCSNSFFYFVCQVELIPIIRSFFKRKQK